MRLAGELDWPKNGCAVSLAGEPGIDTPPGFRMTLRTTKLDAEPEGLMAGELLDDLRDLVELKLVSTCSCCWVFGLEGRDLLNGQNLRAGEGDLSLVRASMARY